MRRPWWGLVAVCAALAAMASGLGWLTRITLSADQQRRQIAAQSEHEQQISLVLWRMDTALAPIIAREAARPWWTIAPGGVDGSGELNFAAQGEPADKGEPVSKGGAIAKGEPVAKGAPAAAKSGAVAQPSVLGNNLLYHPPAYVRYHFHWPVDGRPTSPSALADGHELQELAQAIACSALLGQLPTETFPSYDALSQRGALPPVLAQNWIPRNTSLNQTLYNAYAVPAEQSAAQGPAANPGELRQAAQGASAAAEPTAANQADGGSAAQQASRDASATPAVPQLADNEFNSRNARYQVQAAQSFIQQREANSLELPQVISGGLSERMAEGVSQAVWVGDHLLLARRITSPQTIAVQGCELDWPKLKAELIAEAADLPFTVDLEPVRTTSITTVPHRLAGLPVHLVAELPAAAAQGWTTLQQAWAFVWTAFVVCAAGIVAVSVALLSLSEKRASFVSAVTHELRTPLTTFRLYSQMLERGMVPASDQPHYLRVLAAEANRLNHLIDNVLTFARLERGRSQLRWESVKVHDLIERVTERLRQRAAEGAMQLVTVVDAAVANHQVQTDPAVVEQILFNLVDNAVKYAAEAVDRRIQLQAYAVGGTIELAIVDQGRGISAAAARQLFRPFSKSAEQAAATAPGVGLGLALSARLARQLGGRLRHQPPHPPASPPGSPTDSPSPGCRMVLSLER